MKRTFPSQTLRLINRLVQLGRELESVALWAVDATFHPETVRMRHLIRSSLWPLKLTEIEFQLTTPTLSTSAAWRPPGRNDAQID